MIAHNWRARKLWFNPLSYMILILVVVIFKQKRNIHSFTSKYCKELCTGKFIILLIILMNYTVVILYSYLLIWSRSSQHRLVECPCKSGRPGRGPPRRVLGILILANWHFRRNFNPTLPPRIPPPPRNRINVLTNFKSLHGILGGGQGERVGVYS
jgi:hypothetical protein